MKQKILYILFICCLIAACTDPEDLSFAPKPLEEIKSGDTTESHRISVINRPIVLATNEGTQGAAAGYNFGQTAEESSPTFDCDEAITEDFSGSKRVDNKDVTCLEQGTTFAGNLELRGGTFVIKGTAIINAISGNKGTIVVTETGSLSMQSLNLNNNFELQNYGEVQISNGATVSGEFENHGTASIGSLTINGGGEMKNTNALTIAGAFVINKEAENEGILTVLGDLTINGGATLKNKCQLIVEGNAQNNKTLENDSYVRIEGTLTVNGGAEVTFEEEAYMYVGNLNLNGSLEGSNQGYARVDINGSTLANWGSRITKKLDINDTDGLEADNGRYDNDVTFNEQLEIVTTACNPGVYRNLIYPQYTLLADINAPELNGTVLSATDIGFNNGLGVVSYHLNGSGFGGAVDLINFNNVASPAFFMNYLSEVREFNSVFVTDNKLYMAGQRNIDESGYSANDTRGAILYTTDLIDGSAFDVENNWTETPMPSFSGNAVEVLPNGQLLFASGATGGGFYRLSADGSSLLESTPANYAKYVSAYGSAHVFLKGGPGEAQLVIVDNGQTTEVALGASTDPADGKNVVTIADNKAYVTLGTNGLAVVDLDEKEFTAQYQPEVGGLTNGVAVDDDFIYLANGTAGVLLLRKETLEFYAQYKYEGSANLVTVYEDIIFIANGTGGVKVLVRNI